MVWGDVVGGDDALDRRRLGRACLIRSSYLSSNIALHPVAFHPAGRHRVDADLRPEIPASVLVRLITAALLAA